MQLLFEAQAVPLGDRVYIVRSRFLRAIGRQTGKHDYGWLHESFARLFNASLFIETKRYRLGKDSKCVEDWMHLIDRVRFDDGEDTYYFEIDPRIAQLFSNSEFALIEWQKRLQITNQANMAKWLQCLVATSRDRVQRYRVTELMKWMAYQGRERDFRVALLSALGELARLEIISDQRIEPGTKGIPLAVWTKLPGPRDKIARPSGWDRFKSGLDRPSS